MSVHLCEPVLSVCVHECVWLFELMCEYVHEGVCAYKCVSIYTCMFMYLHIFERLCVCVRQGVTLSHFAW